MYCYLYININAMKRLITKNLSNMKTLIKISDLISGQDFKFTNSEIVYTFSMCNGGFMCYCDKGADVTKDEFELLTLGFDTYLERLSLNTLVIVL